jgi:hypothetical protein
VTDPAAAPCRFKDLCLDAADSDVLATFWATAMGRERTDAGDGDGEFHVEPPAGLGREWGIWIGPVPEPRTGKTRVHLDLRLAAADPDPLVTAGATIVHPPDGERRWWVLADPDGNQFCAMPPAPPEWGVPPVEVPTPFELVVDARDPETQARWWAAHLGGTAATRPGTTSWWIESAAGFPWYYWVFNAVPEARTVKNRMHWDVVLRDEDPAVLLAAGATLLRVPDDEVRWWVLADPEGNEFCAFPPGN